MKISIDRDVMLPVVNLVGGIVEKRQTLPILSNILFTIKNSELSLTATDLEIQVKTSIKINSLEEKEFTLPARKINDICKSLQEGSIIEIEIEKEKAKIKSGKSKFLLGTLPPLDYPNIETVEPEYSFRIKNSVFKNLLEKCAFSMAQQDVRYYLNGMLIEINDRKIRSVSTDGHRLALSEGMIEDNGLSNAFLLPRKSVMEIIRLIENVDSILNIEISSNLATINLGRTIFHTKLIDGKFPDYHRVIPTNCDNTAIVNKDMFKNALIRTSILSNEKYKGIRISIENGLMKIQANNPEQETAEEEMPIDYSGEYISIGFNVGYLLDILATINSDEVAIDFSDSNSSSIVRIPGREDTMYVVMPMRL